MQEVLYVYAITRQAVAPDTEGVDQTRNFESVTGGGVAAIFTPVPQESFSQEAIDARAGDLEWLGAIGYRHQSVVSTLMKSTAIIPLRAFSLFSSREALRRYLEENGEHLSRTLDRLDGKQEWTLRIEFDPERWYDALVHRVDSLRALSDQIASSSEGKGFLLRKKLEEEKKRASRDAEQAAVAEIERSIMEKLTCETLAETRERRDGAFPQINVLINRDEESVLQELHSELVDKYLPEGITVALSGPWPPYTFAHGA